MDRSNIFEKKNVSLWLKDGLSSKLPTLEQDIDCDVCVVGAGITGITTAYSLHEAGFKVVLIDKQEPLNLATGNTSAKFTYQHDLIYSDIIKHHNLDKARLYYEAQVEGLAYVRALIDKHNIRCDFKETSAIIYAKTEEEFNELLEEKSAYEKLNIPHDIIYEIPLNIVGTGGLKVPFQFELNPVKYLDALLSYLLEQGVSIFKNTEAKTVVSEGDIIKVVTSDGKTISCKHLVIATAYPFFGGDGFYFTRLAASRFYMTAYPATDHYDDDVMIISNSDSPHSFRFSDTDGIKYILVGGEGHRVGTVDSQVNSYDLLASFAKTYFNVSEPAFKWSAQDYKTVDSIPYIGCLTSKYDNIFVATGFNEWGMSNGSFSALLIRDLIKGTESKYEDLFKPSRGEIKQNIGSFLKNNLEVAKQFVKGKVVSDEIALDDIKNDEGGIIKLHGKRVAAYRDEAGALFLSDSTCTHMGCELEYNNAERSFDCPCHGSRFSYDGKVIEGPAMTDLKKVER